jgi:hypothetical protein
MTFLHRNNIVIDAAANTAIDKMCGFNFVNPITAAPPWKQPLTLLQFACSVKNNLRNVQAKLRNIITPRKVPPEPDIPKYSIIGTVQEQIEILAGQEKLKALGEQVKIEFKDVFELILHVDKLPMDVYCCIKLKDSSCTIAL